MELSLDEEFVLRGFSPHQLAFLPSLNCILASDGRGTFKCVDIVSGKEYPTQGGELQTVYCYTQYTVVVAWFCAILSLLELSQISRKLTTVCVIHRAGPAQFIPPLLSS